MRNHGGTHIGSCQTYLLLLALRFGHFGSWGQLRGRFLLLLTAAVVPPFLFGRRTSHSGLIGAETFLT